MNRVLRFGLALPAFMIAAAWVAWTAGGGGGYGGAPEYHPVTVRMWLDDAFVGGIAPAVALPSAPTTALDLLAAGNDLIYVGPDAPRCPVWSVAWVSPEAGTPSGARVYGAEIRCERTAPAAAQNGTPGSRHLGGADALRDVLGRVGP